MDRGDIIPVKLNDKSLHTFFTMDKGDIIPIKLNDEQYELVLQS